MADALSQSEVQSLLSGIAPASGSMQPPGGASRSRPVLEPGDSQPLHALGALHEKFGNEFAAALSGMLRSKIEVTLDRVEAMTCREFLARIDNPTYFSVLQSEGLAARLGFELSPSIVFAMVDRLLGGGSLSKSVIPARRLTDIELTLVSRISGIAVRSLESAWRNLCELQLSAIQVESDPRRADIVPLEELVYSIRLEMTLGELRGPLHLCIPRRTIEPVAERLLSESAKGQFPSNFDKGGQPDGVNMVVRLGQTKLSAQEIKNLAVGDIIMTERATDQGLDVLIEGRVEYDGVAGVLQGHKAVRIRRPVAPPNDQVKDESGSSPADSQTSRTHWPIAS